MKLSRVLLLFFVLFLCITYATKAASSYEEEEYENEENEEEGEVETLGHKKDGHVKEGHEKGDHKKKGDHDDGDHEKGGKKKGGKKKGDHEKGDHDEGDHEKEGKKKGDDHDEGDHEKKGDDHEKEGKKKGGKRKGDDHDEGDHEKKRDHEKEGKKKGGKKKGDDDDDGDHEKEGKKKGDHKKGGKDKGGDEKDEPIDVPVEGPIGGGPVDDEPIKGGTTFDVKKYGAKGDGSSLDSEAFLKAWEELCKSEASFPVLMIPKGDYVLKSTEFRGPCNAKAVGVQLWGTIISSPQKSDWSKCEDFLSFRNVKNLEISGTGGVDGNGPKWWDNQLSCGKRPTNLALNGCEGVRMSGIHSKNSARNHMSISGTTGATISGITLTAPDESPNTDGIDISSSSSITVQNSVIGSGDDCIAINKNTNDVIVKNVKCGPGHGISIGSLGRDGELARVENIFVSDCTFIKTDNGARIKTWKGGRGYVRNVVYRDITLIDVRRPIIIDQNYVDKHHKHENEESSLSISNVKFINFKGTCREPDAITLKCSNSGSGCSGVELTNVNIQGASGVKPEATCENANVRTMQSQPPVTCGQKAGTFDYSEYLALNETD